MIGSGPVGIFLAHRLLEAGKQVILFESGLAESESGFLNRASYEFITPSALPHNVHRAGGGGNYWMNRVSEFADIDFEEHISRPGSKWPISILEMRGLYKSLSIELFPETPSDSGIAELVSESSRVPLPEGIALRPFSYMKPDYFVNLLSKLKLNPNFTFKEGFFCEKFLNLPDGRVELHFQTSTGIVLEVVDVAVLSCGALQSPSLVSRSIMGQDMQAANVGSCLMEHIEGYIGSLRISKSQKPAISRISLTIDRKIDGQPFGVGIAISQELSKRNGWPNFQVEIVPFIPEYRFSSYLVNSLKESSNPLVFSLMKKIAFGERATKKIFYFLYHRLLRFAGINYYSLWLKSEEFPNKESYVAFDSVNNKTIYHHKVSQVTQDKLREGLQYLQRVFHNHNTGAIIFYRKILDNSKHLYLRPNWHPMGTLSMSPDLSPPIVGRNQNLIGFNNVYICDSSLFPTGSNSNPVFTALALGLRLSRFLKQST